MADKDKVVACSFCGKTRNSVEKLIAGPNVYICDECITISYGIVAEVREEPKEEVNDPAIPTPKEIRAHLDEYIIGHNETKELLSVSVYNHYKRLKLNRTGNEIDKSNILLIGPTGVGKTLFAKTLARKMNVPFAIADATTLTEAGYVGEDVESVLERLLAAADHDVEKAQQGIIYIDEIDKKARKSESNTNSYKDVSGEGVQQALLRLIEGTVTKIRLNNSRSYGPEEFIEFDTSNILFILGGAFVGIDHIIEKRKSISSGSVGFQANIVTQETRTQLLRDVNHHDITQFGIIPELAGRLPLIGTLEKLDENTFVQILSGVKNNIVEQTKELLLMDEIEIEFGDDFIKEVAQIANRMGLGARALRTVMDQVTLNIMYRAPDLRELGVQRVFFNKYPNSPQRYPMIMFRDRINKPRLDKDYKLYRGDNEN